MSVGCAGARYLAEVARKEKQIIYRQQVGRESVVNKRGREGIEHNNRQCGDP